MGSLSDDQIARLRQSGIADSFGGRFQILREAGAGGMGRVYQAVDPDRDRQLAIKVLARQTLDDLARFAAEAEVLEKLEHEAIVAYVAHGTTPDGEPYLAMAWLDGESLASRLRRELLSVREAVQLAERVAGALAYAHSRGVVHRDLKPSNLILAGGDPGRAVLVDFGVARDSAVDRALTRTGQMVGTPGFMAPEQARGGGIDGRADLFALGCVLYQSLTGRPPFDADELIGVLALLLLEDPAPLGELAPAVPRRLESLVSWLLAKDPAARPADAERVAAELAAIARALDSGDDEALATELVVPERATGATVVERRPKREPRRRRIAIGAAIAVAGLVGVGLVVMAGGEEQRSSTSTITSTSTCGRDVRRGCEERCGAGDVEACYLLGQAQAHGLHGVERDRPTAIGTLRAACERGHGRGCYDVALLLHLASKETASRDWLPEFQTRLEKSCELGFASGCRKLGNEYRTDADFLPSDAARSRSYFDRACALGDSYSCRQRAADQR
jgi:hypothetical protein